jgi:ArsR family transcriptional regulator
MKSLIMKVLVKIFKALSDPSRVRIIKMLENKPLCVCEMTSILNLATSTVSKHLYLLREADLIIDEKEGKWVNYRLNPAGQENIRKILSLLANEMLDDETIKKDRRMVQTIDRRDICGI